MAQNEYSGKWKKWLHPVSNGRWIVAEHRGDYWFTKNHKGEAELKGHSPLDLVGKGTITYASVNSAIKALLRVYDLNAGETRAPESISS